MTYRTASGTEATEYEERIHRAVVTGVKQLGPGMIRVTLGGDDLLDYPTTGIGDEYVRLFFPDEAHLEPRLPFVSGRGWDYEEGVEPSQMRTYTIRDHRSGEIDIDFVIHEGVPMVFVKGFGVSGFGRWCRLGALRRGRRSVVWRVR